MSVTGLGSTGAAWVVNVLSTVVTVLGAASIGRTIAGEIGARRAAWAFALYPAMLLWSAATMTETLQCAWITVAIALAVARPREEHQRASARSVALRSCAVGLAAGLATLVRPQGILLAPVLGALSPRASLKHRALGATIALASALAVCTPWTARNARVLDGPALVSTNGGSNLLIGTLPEAHGGYRELTDRDPCAQVSGEVRRDRCMSRAAIERIRRDPAQWIALGARKVARMIGFEWAPVSYARSTVPQRISQEIGLVLAALCTLCWWLVMALAARFVWRQREGEVARAVAATFITVVGVHAVFITDDRYHLVLVGALCAVAANAIYPAKSATESASTDAVTER